MDPSDDDRIHEMRQALKSLRKETGRDFGYDLEAWHNYLINSDEHREQYTFHYAWDAVKSKIVELISDPERSRLCREITTNGGIEVER